MRPRYLLDTNVLVDILRGTKGDARKRLLEIGIDHCAVSEITVYELYCGAAASASPEANQKAVETLLALIEILPLQKAYLEAARQKASLRKAGTPVEDFDLLIGCTALCDSRILLTGNRKHMERIEGLALEDWGE